MSVSVNKQVRSALHTLPTCTQCVPIFKISSSYRGKFEQWESKISSSWRPGMDELADSKRLKIGVKSSAGEIGFCSS